MGKLTDFIVRQVLPFLLRVAAVGALAIGILEAVEDRAYGHLTPVMWFLLALAAFVAMTYLTLDEIEARLGNLLETMKTPAAEAANPGARSEARAQRQQFCPNCGQVMPRGAKFCEQCGAHIGDYVPGR